MKLIIDIPKEFEEHFNNDRFQESFERILSEAINKGMLFQKC